MKNNSIANGLIASIGLSFFTALFIADYNTSETMYLIAGFGMMIFGIMAIIRLKK